MGCKLLEIMADGLYAVFHRFEAFLKKGWRTSSDCWMSIQRPSCFFNLYSSCSSRSNKRRRDCLLPPPRRRLCCRAGLTDTSPSYLLFQTLLPLFWTLTCMIGMELTRTDAVFSRIAMVLFLCRNKSSWNDLKLYVDYFGNNKKSWQIWRSCFNRNI